MGNILRGDVHSPPSMGSSSCAPHLHDQEKKPIGDHPRSEVHLSLSLDSLSCVPYLHDRDKNCNEGARDISSEEVVVAAREFFPLTPDRMGFLGTKEVSDPHREIVPARHNGVSIELALLFDPYKIKKKLTQSDLGHLSRLLIGRDCVKSHILRWMSEETVQQVESGKGANVIVRDVDKRSEHRLVFVFWASSGSYVFKGGWITEFVKRRGLVVGDEIGIYWDPSANKFHFSLLHKAN